MPKNMTPSSCTICKKPAWTADLPVKSDEFQVIDFIGLRASCALQGTACSCWFLHGDAGVSP